MPQKGLHDPAEITLSHDCNYIYKFQTSELEMDINHECYSFEFENK